MTQYFTPAAPRVLAHRGLALEAPENTLLAFAAALNAGATHLETDVHGAADGVAMISHDPDLTRLAGRAVRVEQLTSHELRRVQLGAAQGYCSLAELLDAFPDARVNVDVKARSAIPGTIAAIRDARATDRVLVGSFSETRRRAVADALPGVATSASSPAARAAVLAAIVGAGPGVRRALRGLHAIQIPPRLGRVATLTAATVERFHAAGVEVHAWTINDPAEMHRLLDLGVDGIVSDRADLAVGALRDRATP